jgi:hypothetical protein
VTYLIAMICLVWGLISFLLAVLVGKYLKLLNKTDGEHNAMEPRAVPRINHGFKLD